ncbi:hypothetical protein, partial [Burkholderia cenocepacia]|uniref:hypothetical protein n=1 Tax=Burkholderia cenocepacia TaxID=95486 RepID=UPI0038CBFA3D
MSDAKDAEVPDDEPVAEPSIGAVPTWDWRAGTDFRSLPSPSASWAPQPIETASSDARGGWNAA